MLSKLKVNVFLGIVLASAVGYPADTAEAQLKLAFGQFEMTDTGISRGFVIDGTALMVRSSAGTCVWAQVVGLQPNVSYGSHVHDLPCSLGGGGHNKIDPTVSGTVEANEIWPLLAADADGIAYGFATTIHEARVEAHHRGT